jgi:hypothetical protein
MKKWASVEPPAKWPPGEKTGLKDVVGKRPNPWPPTLPRCNLCRRYAASWLGDSKVRNAQLSAIIRSTPKKVNYFAAESRDSPSVAGTKVRNETVHAGPFITRNSPIYGRYRPIVDGNCLSDRIYRTIDSEYSQMLKNIDRPRFTTASSDIMLWGVSQRVPRPLCARPP